MKIRFTQNCTVYPDGERVDAFVDDEREIADAEYARLLIDKGHAVEIKAEKPSKAGAADKGGDGV